MKYTNYEVAHSWAHGHDDELWGLNMRQADNKLYSFQTVIGQRLHLSNGNVVILINNGCYSQTITKHQCDMVGAIPSNTPTINISPFGFRYEWGGISDSPKSYQFDLLSIIKKMLLEFVSRLHSFERSRSLSTERDFVPVLNTIDEIVNKTGLVSWEEIEAIPLEEWERVNKRSGIWARNPECISIILEYRRQGKTTIADMVTAVCGEETWKKYYVWTLPARKAQATRLGLPQPATNPSIEEYSKQLRKADLKAREAEIKRKREEKEKEEAEWVAKREEWWNGSQRSFFKAPSWIFFGGNVLLRVRNNGEIVETSKGIGMTAEQAKKIFQLIQGFRSGKIPFEANRYCFETKTNSWKVNNICDKFVTSGCHTLAFEEIDRVAKQLGLL